MERAQGNGASLGVDELHWAGHRGWRGRFTLACVNIKSSCPHSASQTGHFLHEVRNPVRQQGGREERRGEDGGGREG